MHDSWILKTMFKISWQFQSKHLAIFERYSGDTEKSIFSKSMRNGGKTWETKERKSGEGGEFY